MLSITFYDQFSDVLQSRILQQLNSIKTLKQNQLEKLIQSEWHNFVGNPELNDSLGTPLVRKNLTSGIYDFTEYQQDKSLTVVMIAISEEGIRTQIIPRNKIMNILLERTGMGETGESYLVGNDYRMRSKSRFFNDSIPYFIKVNTLGVENALSGRAGKGLYKDYRNVDVYGVYGPISVSNLKLAILSEIDESEVKEPLVNLKKRLFGFMFLIMIIAIFLSIFLTRIIANPILKMKKSLNVMADGHYDEENQYSSNSNEMREMFEALGELKKSLQGAVNFSKAIGEMNLNASYTPKSNKDSLGRSLLKMQKSLKEFREKENISRMNAKRQLVDGLEKERQRLARELHDGLGPLLTSLKFMVDNSVENEKLRVEMKSIVDETINEVRAMSNALMPAIIVDFGVGPALNNFIESINKTSGIKIYFEDLLKHKDSKVTKNQEIHLFRIVQELVNNSLKHANAQNVRITLSELDEFISLFYYDDGKGFNIKTTTLGSGIINIKERIEICKGSIIINSKEGSTIFEIELPIEENED